MGRIFTLLEVKQRKVPTLESFTPVQHSVAKTLEQCPSIIGAVLYGSAAHGRLKLRSDLDVAVFFDEEQEDQWITTRKKLENQAAEVFVPLNIVEATERNMSHPLTCPIDAGLLLHLQWAATIPGCAIKQDPFAQYAPDEQAIREATKHYLIKRKHALNRGECAPGSDTERCRFLQKIVDNPLHIARRMLACHGFLAEDDSKEKVIELYAEHFPKLASFLEQIQYVNRLYDQALKRLMISPHRATPLYLETLDCIFALAPDLRRFIDANYRLLP